jgi:hypothetical protein
MIKYSFLMLILILIGNATKAQEVMHKNPFWLNFSAGGSPQYLNFSSSYNKELDNISYQISINGSFEGILDRKGMTTGNAGLGLVKCKEWLISSIYLGPSVSYGETYNKLFRNVSFWGVGFALNAQAYFMPLHKLFPGVGLGIELFYNLNAIQTINVNYRQVYSIRIGVTLTNLHMK